MDPLVRLETVVRKAYAYDEHLFSIFHDLEKAYDLTWRYGIIRDLFNIRVRGRIAGYIEEFLLPQRFQVRMDGVVSDEYIHETGAPQDRVLSVTLFPLKIREITHCIWKDNRILVSLNVDNLQILFRHTDLRVIKEKLQEIVHGIYTRASNNGCKFSLGKTKAVHFTNQLTVQLPPSLYFSVNKLYHTVKEKKIFGVTFDSKLSFISHIAQLNVDYTRTLNLMRTVFPNDSLFCKSILQPLAFFYIPTGIYWSVYTLSLGVV